MSTRHTPGPWMIEDRSTVNQYRAEVHSSETYVALVVCALDDHRTISGAMSDARLIAAAPELLEALEDVLAAWLRQHPHDDRVQGDFVTRARAALAKAKGEV